MAELPEYIRCVICHKARVPLVYRTGAWRAECPHCEQHYTVTPGELVPYILKLVS